LESQTIVFQIHLPMQLRCHPHKTATKVSQTRLPRQLAEDSELPQTLSDPPPAMQPPLWPSKSSAPVGQQRSNINNSNNNSNNSKDLYSQCTSRYFSSKLCHKITIETHYRGPKVTRALERFERRVLEEVTKVVYNIN
jgi:hypothetical protein